MEPVESGKVSAIVKLLNQQNALLKMVATEMQRANYLRFRAMPEELRKQIQKEELARRAKRQAKKSAS